MTRPSTAELQRRRRRARHFAKSAPPRPWPCAASDSASAPAMYSNTMWAPSSECWWEGLYYRPPKKRRRTSSWKDHEEGTAWSCLQFLLAKFLLASSSFAGLSHVLRMSLFRDVGRLPTRQKIYPASAADPNLWSPSSPYDYVLGSKYTLMSQLNLARVSAVPGTVFAWLVWADAS